MTSVVACENLITVSQKQIIRKLGALAPVLMGQVDAALKEALNLP
jgi:mRNA-degrading endonuclease toxin of MazEF toxin-antitoxin module